jgi:hypothetical protein
MSSHDPNSSGIFTGVFNFITQELESFVTSATGGHVPEVRFLQVHTSNAMLTHTRRVFLSAFRTTSPFL